jgi:hypothetical protein
MDGSTWHPSSHPLHRAGPLGAWLAAAALIASMLVAVTAIAPSATAAAAEAATDQWSQGMAH